MNSNQIETYRQGLLALANRHDDAMTRVRDEVHGVGGESSGNLSDVPVHPGDLGTEYHAEEVDLILMENEETLLAETNAALARIDAGTFGICARCFKDIPTGRLDAFPYARFCLPCFEALRAEGINPLGNVLP
jgi:DnaK suppressor protein